MGSSFTFVRHGRTDWSRADITKGPGDFPLNSLGREDALQAAAFLDPEESSYVIISSDLARARETAQIIADKIKVPIHIFPDLNERYFGDYSVLSTEDLASSLTPSDAEDELPFKSRVSRAISNIFTNPSFHEKQKIIVSHGLVFRYLSSLLTGKEESINYGEVCLFVPKEGTDFWEIIRTVL